MGMENVGEKSFANISFGELLIFLTTDDFLRLH
jgi:hypothetical protein